MKMKKVILLITALSMLFAVSSSVFADHRTAEIQKPDEIVQIVNELAAFHGQQFVNSKSSCDLSMSLQVIDDLNERAYNIRQMKNRIGASFVDAAACVEIIQIDTSDNGFEVTFNETTILTYRYPNSEESDVMEFSVLHRLEISRDHEIVSDRFSEEMVTGFSNCE